MGEAINSTSEKLGLYDFFNVLFSGGIFLMGLVWTYPCVWTMYQYIDIGNQKYVYLVVFTYMVGMCLQDIASILDVKVFKIKENMVSNFLRKKSILGNKYKYNIAVEHGRRILVEHNIEIKGKLTKKQNRFIYAYCYYNIEILGKHLKYEKMRALLGLSQMLLSNSAILAFVSLLSLKCDIYALLKTIVFILLGILFYHRSKTIANYKARMLMSIYDGCYELKQEESNEETSDEINKTTKANI